MGKIKLWSRLKDFQWPSDESSLLGWRKQRVVASGLEKATSCCLLSLYMQLQVTCVRRVAASSLKLK